MRDIIDRQVRHLARLVDDLLDLSRINTGKIQLRLEDVGLDEVVRLAIEAVQPTFQAADIVLSASPVAPSLVVRGDKVRLTQVLVNLLGNAAKFSPPRTTVRVEVDRMDSHARIRVQDQGVGLAAGDLERIFEMFSQVRNGVQPSNGGLGIGLGLVRSLVQLHGGTVTAKSDGMGQGSVFTTLLPLLPSMPAAGPAAETEGTSTRRLRVLVADDNPDAVETLSLLLELLGHEVHMASDGHAAVALALQVSPDAVLMDIGMPGMSGLEACRLIRRSHLGESLHIVALSGWGSPRTTSALRRRDSMRTWSNRWTSPRSGGRSAARRPPRRGVTTGFPQRP